MVDKEDDYTKIDIARTLWRIDSNQFALAAPLAQSLVAAKLENACHTGNFGNDVTSALDLLGEMGTNARSVSPRLREGLRANDALLRFSVAWASCRIAPEEKQLAMQTLQDLVRPGKARARGSNDSFVRAREREAHGQREYFAGLAAAGALWQLQPDRRPELQRLILLLLEEWEQWAAYEFPSDEQVLIPPLNEILKDPAAPAAHPLAGSVLAEISGSAGERW
jgi:hypothetical protein